MRNKLPFFSCLLFLLLAQAAFASTWTTDSNTDFQLGDFNYCYATNRGNLTVSGQLDWNFDSSFPAAYDANLILYWTFNRDSNTDSNATHVLNKAYGTAANKCTQYSCDGNYISGATNTAAGLWDTNSLLFDGANDYIVFYPQNKNLGITSKLAMEAWVKFPQAFDKDSNADFVLLDSGAMKFYFDSTSGKLKLEAVNSAQGGWATSYASATSGVLSLAVYDGNLFAANYVGSGDANIYTYDGTNWSMSYNTTNGYARSLTVYDGNLFASYLDTSAYWGYVLAFDGTNWTNIYSIGDSKEIEAFAVYDGNLFAGQGYNAGDGDVYTYDGTNWTKIYDGSKSGIYGLAAYDGNLFAAQIGTIAGDGDVLTYNGTNWSTSYNGSQEAIYSLAVYDRNLFAGQGSGTGDGDVISFNGTTWATSLDGGQEYIESLAVYDGNLFAGQGTGNGDGDIYTYNGTNWSLSYDTFGTTITSFAAYDGNLFAGQQGAVNDGNVFTFGNGFSVSSSRNSWSAGTWYHVAATYDGTTAKIYVNGTLDGTRTKSITIDNLQNNRFSNKAFVGRATGTRQSGIDASFKAGTLEEFRIFDKNLSAAQIGADYNAYWSVIASGLSQSGKYASYFSKVFDAGQAMGWDDLKWGETGTDSNKSAKVQARSCANSNCSDGSWKGPDGTASTYFTGGGTTWDLNSLAYNRYAQYRIFFDSSYSSIPDTPLFPFVSDLNVTYSTDATAPTTSWDGNSTWQGTDANVHLTCNDSGSGCSSTKYRKDTDATSAVTMGVWTAYDANIFITADGNWAIDFNSTDAAGNIGDTNRRYTMIDKTAPTTSWDGNTTWSAYDQNIALTCNDAGAGCSSTKYRLDSDSTSGVTMGSWQTYTAAGVSVANDGNWAIDFNSTDIAGNIGDTNRGYVLINKSSGSSNSGSGGVGKCAYRGGIICVQGESCSGLWILSEDSSRCCKGLCYSKDAGGEITEPAEPEENVEPQQSETAPEGNADSGTAQGGAGTPAPAKGANKEGGAIKAPTAESGAQGAAAQPAAAPDATAYFTQGLVLALLVGIVAAALFYLRIGKKGDLRDLI